MKRGHSVSVHGIDVGPRFNEPPHHLDVMVLNGPMEGRLLGGIPTFPCLSVDVRSCSHETSKSADVSGVGRKV